MNLNVIGISHQTAPVELREKISFSPAQLEQSLERLKQQPQAREAVALSTCNRTEIYWCADDNKPDWCMDFLSNHMNCPELRANLYHKFDQAMIEHLFYVSSGLDSMVIGENEILKQVKEAYQTCHAFGLTGKIFNVLFQRALYVGKLVRTQTGISKGGMSVGSVAVALAELIFGELSKSTVMIFGAGEIAEVTARFLISKKVQRLLVANRTLEHAQILAKPLQARALTLEQGLQSLNAADIVVTSMAAQQPVLTRAVIEQAMAERQNRSLFLIDIAVPRNIDPSVHQLDNVYLYNIDDLDKRVAENSRTRTQDIEQARAIAAKTSAEFFNWFIALKQGDEKSLKHRADWTQTA